MAERATPSTKPGTVIREIETGDLFTVVSYDPMSQTLAVVDDPTDPHVFIEVRPEDVEVVEDDVQTS